MEKIEKQYNIVNNGALSSSSFSTEKTAEVIIDKINEIVDWCNNLDSYLKHK